MYDISGGVATGWEIGVFSYKFVWKNKKLLVFPCLSAASMAAAIALLYSLSSHNVLPTLVLGYFLSVFFVIFFNVAIIAVANSYLTHHQEPSIILGVMEAGKKVPQIILWTFIAGTIGIILRLLDILEEKLEFPVISWMFGAIWGVVTFFVVPVICFTPTMNPFSLIRGSIGIIKKSWREEQTTKIISSGMVSMVLGGVLLGIYMLVQNVHLVKHTVGDTVVMLISFYGNYVVIALGLVLLSFSMVTKAVLQAIFYQYLENNIIPKGMDKALLENAFMHKSLRRK